MTSPCTWAMESSGRLLAEDTRRCPQAGSSGGRPTCAHRDYDSHAAMTAVTTVRMAIAPWISIVSSPPAPAPTR